jgi:carbonic anhydrase/acetyltransferase-like protein (isoleucine patch superfamily)
MVNPNVRLPLQVMRTLGRQNQRELAMILEHLGMRPSIDPSAYVAPSATVCGQVAVGPHTRIMHGASVVAEGGSIEIGEYCIILENAVVRSTAKHSTMIGKHTLIGPNAHIVGCTVGECVFIATGAAVFHAAHLESCCEVRVNGVVHTRTRVSRDTTIPIGWVAVGDPATILPPHAHDEIWSKQEPLNFPMTVYGMGRPPEGETIMPQITRRLSQLYASHKEDKML